MVKTVTGTRIATLTLDGTESSVTYGHVYKAFAVQNLGDSTVYASKNAGVAAGSDGVVAIPSGGSAVVYANSDTVYLLGSGTVQVIAQYDGINPFKASPKGGEYLPIAGGMTTGTTGLANNFRAVSGSTTRLQFLINGVWQTCLTGDAASSGGVFGNSVWKSLKLNVDNASHAYINDFPIYSTGYKPFAAGSFGKAAEEASVDCGFAPTYVLIFSSGASPVIYSSESEEITLSDTGFTVSGSVAENTYSYIAFR